MNAVNPLSEAPAVDVPNFEALLDPYPVYAELAKLSPVVKMRTRMGMEIYGVTRWDAAVAVLRDARLSKSGENIHAAFASNPGAAGAVSPIAGIGVSSLLNTDPPDHTRLRNLVNLSFSPKRIELLRQRVEALVDSRIAALAGKKQADMIGLFAYPIGITMICELLGVPEEGREQFRNWANAAMSPGDPQQLASRQSLLEYLKNLIVRKRAGISADAQPDEQPDVLSAMICSRMNKDALSEDELLGMSYMLLIAGHETTVGLIGNALRLLATHPEQQAALRAEPQLIKPAIDEVLRFDGPVHRTTMRATAQDMDVAGVAIPAHALVQVMLAACNRDPVRFPDPNRFDIRRTPGQTLAFGFGAHFCLGQHLAKLEAQTAIGKALQAFPVLQLDVALEDIQWAGTVIRTASELPMRLA